MAATGIGIPLAEATLPGDAVGWFSGAPAPEVQRSTPVGRLGNVAARRPHRPVDLARARDEIATATGTEAAGWHLMRQVHGREVGIVDASVPPGRELDGVDALVTALPGRALVVLVADCVPVLLASGDVVAAVHAGRAGVAAGVVETTVRAMEAQDARAGSVHAVIGPAIGACCYEVPSSLRDEVAAIVPETAATTSWGTPALDLVAGVRAQLAALGARVQRVGGCTRCEPGSFSHRGDPDGGRQLGLVVRRAGTEVAS